MSEVARELSVYEKLQEVQSELQAPKGQWNDYSKYYYRSCEDILEGLKPLLKKYRLLLTIEDDIEQIGDRFYLVAKVRLMNLENADEAIEIKANAREPENKTGMDQAQVTGATSSYARKYALNGMFAIDDAKDADGHDNRPKKQSKSKGDMKGCLTEAQIKRLYAIGYSKGLDATKINNQVMTKYKKKVEELSKEEYDTVCKGYEGMEGK